MSKRSRQKTSSGAVYAYMALIALGLVFMFSSRTVKLINGARVRPAESFSRELVMVEKAVDGDTLRLADGRKVRLIGIDTPEVHESQKLYRDSRKSGQDVLTIQALGRRAHAFTRDLVEGREIRLEFDVEKKDKYGRLLAYAYLTDGTFVNAKIIEQGYASLMTYPPNVKYADQFLKLYQQARADRRGLWK